MAMNVKRLQSILINLVQIREIARENRLAKAILYFAFDMDT